MKKLQATILLVIASGLMLVQQLAAQAAGQPAPAGQSAPSGQGTQKKEIKNPAEYNAYVNAIQQQNPAQKAQLLEAFLQSYSGSVMKEDALETLMFAYQQAGDAQKSLDAANRVLQANPNNLKALDFLSYSYHAAASQGGPQMQDNVAKAKQYGTQGLQALTAAQKPDEVSQPDWDKLKKQSQAIFDGAVGYAALVAKDYPTAQKDFREAVANEAQPEIIDLYQLATSDLEANPINPEGFWFVVKASNLAQGGGQQQILDYGRRKYAKYHGPDADKDWEPFVASVKANPSVLPPADFTVTKYTPPSPAEQAADLVKKTDPTQMSFADWELVLSSGNQQAADTVWNAIKEKVAPLGAQVISATPTKLTLAGSQDDIDTKTADITLTMEKPLPAKYVPAVGTLAYFRGTVKSYTPSPFMLTMTEGVLLDKNGKPLATTAAPVHHTTH